MKILLPLSSPLLSKSFLKIIGISLYLTILTFNVFAQTPNSWTQKADLGGTARANAVGFSIGTKGYIGTGDGGEINISS